MQRTLYRALTSILTLLFVVSGLALSVRQANAEELCVEAVCVTTNITDDIEISTDQNGKKLKKFLEERGYKLLSTSSIDVTIRNEIAEKNKLSSRYKFISSLFLNGNNELGYLTYSKSGSSKFMLVSTSSLTPYMVRGNKVEPVASEEIKRLIPETLHHILHPVDHGVLTTVNEFSTMATSCKTAKGYYERRNILGTEILYRWWQEKYFCYDGNYLSSTRIQAYATNIAASINYYGQIGQFNRDCNPGALPQCHESGRQGKFENVVPAVGPVGYSYPWVSIMNNAQGHFAIGSWE